PDLIIELTSPSTATEDRTAKMALYEGTFRTREYFLHDPETHRTEGWRLGPDLRYAPIEPDAHDRFWCQTLGLWLGPWEGTFAEAAEPTIWPRFYPPDGQLVQVDGEAERRRAEAAEAEVARLRALVEELRQQHGEPPGPAA